LGYEEALTIEMCMPLMAPFTLRRPHQALDSFIRIVIAFLWNQEIKSWYYLEMNASTNSCKIKNIVDFLLQIVEHCKQGNWHFDWVDKQYNKHKCL